MDKFLIRIDRNKDQFHRNNKSESGGYSDVCQSEEKVKDNLKRLSNTPDIISEKRIRLDKDLSDCSLHVSPYSWRIIKADNLRLKYAKVFSKETAHNIFKKLEEEVQYFSGDLLKVRVFGKWQTIPRKQVSFGDPGLSYAFSGNCVPALPWSTCDIIRQLKPIVESACECSFNFVLVNRYKDGSDYMGEHRDDEKDLVPDAPIASLSFGQTRDFVFRHKDARGVKASKKIAPVKLQLEHGSLLLMEWPTNRFWYHQLPVRKNVPNVRINLTFRAMVEK